MLERGRTYGMRLRLGDTLPDGCAIGPVRSAACSVRGARSRNEDSYLRDDVLGLYLVADGVGGQADGDVASGLAIREVFAYLCSEGVAPGSANEAGTILQRAFSHANAIIRSHGRRVLDGGVAATTLVGAWCVENLLVVANVGDSRAYLQRWREDIRLLTEDHTAVRELMLTRGWSEEEARDIAPAHLVTRCLGGQYEVEADIRLEPFHPGDRVLICSDGVYEMLSNKELGQLVDDRGPPLEHICRRLVDKAKRAANGDNATALLVEFGVQEGAYSPSAREFGGAAANGGECDKLRQRGGI